MPNDFSNLLLACAGCSELMQLVTSDELWKELVIHTIHHINRSTRYKAFIIPTKNYRLEFINIVKEIEKESKRKQFQREEHARKVTPCCNVALSGWKLKESGAAVRFLQNWIASNNLFEMVNVKSMLFMYHVYSSFLETPRVVFVGSPSCGRTSLLSKMCNLLNFEPLELPFSGKVRHMGQMMEIVAPSIRKERYEPYFNLRRSMERSQFYSNARLVVICFSISCESSYWDVCEKWIPELQHQSPNTPCIVVGCKKDHRNSKHETQLILQRQQLCIQQHEGLHLANRIGALCYVETSAETGDGVESLLRLLVDLLRWVYC